MIPKDLRSRVSRWAHAAGITHAATVKACLLRDLERLKASGAPYATLVEHLDHIERGEGGAPAERSTHMVIGGDPVVPTAFRL